MPSIPPVYRAIVLDQQAQLARLVRSAGVAPTKRLYQEMLADLEKKLGAARSGTFTHQQLQIMMAQVKLGMAQLARGSAEVVRDGSAQVGVHAARTLLENAARLEDHFTGAAMPIPLLQSARLRGMVEGKTQSLLRVHASSMARYGVRMTGRIETQLASSLSQGEDQTRAIDRVMKVADLEWHGAERIVRTEMSFAANASAREAADEQADELDGDMWSRWTEHVTDGGSPLDDRVGVDSEAMHGQVAPPGGMFTQPPTAPDGALVGESLVGEGWSSPPNRPNDRAVLVPWRASWGVPGWRWDGGRVPVTEDHAARTNAAWMRARGRPTEQPRHQVFERDPAEERPLVQVPSPVTDVEELDFDEPAAPTIGFESPIVRPNPVPSHDDVRAEIARTKRVYTEPKPVHAPAILDEGWFEPEDIAADARAIDDAMRKIRSGMPGSVGLGVAPSGKVVLSEGGHTLHAAVESGSTVPVKWTTASEPDETHVMRGGMRIGTHRIPDAGADVATTRAVPVGRPDAAAIREAEARAAKRLADDEEREWEADRAKAKAKIAEHAAPRGTTSIWRPGDDQRRKESAVVQLAAPKSESFYERDLRIAREHQEKVARERERFYAQRPPEIPRGYDMIEDPPGTRIYISQRTGRRYTEADVRRGVLDPGVPEFAVPGAQVRRPSWLARIGQRIRSALGRA